MCHDPYSKRIAKQLGLKKNKKKGAKMFSNNKGQLLFPFSMRQPIIVKVCRKLSDIQCVFVFPSFRWRNGMDRLKMEASPERSKLSLLLPIQVLPTGCRVPHNVIPIWCCLSCWFSCWRMKGHSEWALEIFSILKSYVIFVSLYILLLQFTK